MRGFLIRYRFLPCAAALMVGGPRLTGTVPDQPEPEGVEQVLVSAAEPRYVAPTTRDRIGRIWAPVLINGKGPYRLVLDTGASHFAITQRVVDDLGLHVDEYAVRLRGATGSAVVPALRVGTFEIGDLLIENATAAIVADAFGGADGVFGGESLDDKRIRIGFHDDVIRISRSHREPAPPGFLVVPFSHGGGGMRVEVRVGSVKATALVDTGAQVTVGNLALREALARHRGEGDSPEVSIVGVTEDIQQATRLRIPSIFAGQLVMRNATIMFSDLHIFEHWNLVSKPALLIGMDAIGVLDTVIIDYKRSELQIRPTRL